MMKSVFNRFHILLKLHYFLFFAGSGALYPILSITLGHRGLTHIEISYINLVIPFLVFVTNPCVGLLADRSRRFLFTFNSLIAFATIFYIMLFLMPSIKCHKIHADMRQTETLGRVLDICTSEYVATTCASKAQCGCVYQAECTSLTTIMISNETKHLNVLDFNFTMNSKYLQTNRNDVSNNSTKKLSQCGFHYEIPIENVLIQRLGNHTIDPFRILDSSMMLTNTHLATCEIHCSIRHYCYGSRYPQQIRIILLYAIIFIISANFLSNCVTIGTSIGFATLQSPDQFGQQRLWGTIGSGFSGFLASRLYTYFPTEYIYLWIYLIFIVLSMFVTSMIPIRIRRPSEIEYEKANRNQFSLSTLLPVIKQIDVIIFLLITLIWGMSFGSLDPYLFLHIDEIAACQARSILGWMSLISSTIEVIAFFVADKFLTLLGTNICSIMIFVAFAARFAGYYTIHEPYWILPNETYHFFNFGILYVLVSKRADAIAPPGLTGTFQSFVYGLLFGLGRGIGLIISMFAYSGANKRRLFLIFAILNISSGIIYFFYFLTSKCYRSSSSLSEVETKPVHPSDTIESGDNLNDQPLLTSSNETNNNQS